MVSVRLTEKAFGDLSRLPIVGQRIVLGGLGALAGEPEVGAILWAGEPAGWSVRFAVLDENRFYFAAYLTDARSSVEVQAVGRGGLVELMSHGIDDLISSVEDGSRPEARPLVEYLENTDDQVVRTLIRIRLGQPDPI